MNTKIEARNRILSLTLALCLLLTMTLVVPGPVEVRAANVELGTAADLTPDPNATGIIPGNRVYFGEYNGVPILWRVLENSGGEALLFSESILHTMPFKEFINVWAESSIREYLNTELLEKLPDVLQKQGVIVETDTTIGSNPTNDKLYLLSVDEVQDYSLIQNELSGSGSWWLRSPGSVASNAAVVNSVGSVSSSGGSVYFDYGIRPAFRLHLSSAIFTSAGDGSKGNPWVVGEQGNLLEPKSLVKDEYIKIQIGNEDTWWKVIEVRDDKATLLCTDVLEQRMAFNDRGNIWALSDVRAFLNPENEWAYNANTFSFAEGEREAINAVQIIERGMTTNDTLFLLSDAEAEKSEYFSDKDARKAGGIWWLRSPGNRANVAAVVFSDGDVDSLGNFVTGGYSIRPAFRLDLSSVLFTSDASGVSPKSDIPVGGALSSAAKPQSGAVKLTVLDDDQKLEGVELTGGNGTGTLGFSYTSAKTGTDQFISCVLMDQTNEVTYYGKLEDTSSSYTGTVNVPLSGVSDGDYTLKIFSEQANGNQETDYAGGIHEFAVTVVNNGEGFAGSADAALVSVAGQTIIAGNEAGHSNAPKTAAIDLDSTWDSISDSDLEAINRGKAELYNDTYTTPQNTVTLQHGANELYIKVTSQNELAVMYYHVTATRQNAAAPTLTMTPVKTTLTVGEKADNQTVATADAKNFTGTVTFSIDGTPTLPAGLDIDSSNGRIFVDDADALVKSISTVTVKADDGTDFDTDTVTVTIRESGGSPDPGPTVNPSATIDNSTLQVGDTATLRVSLGQSGGASMATGAHIAVDDEEVVSVNRNSLDADGDVTVTATGVGETDIHITFDGVSGYDKTLHVKVSDSGTTPPVNPPTTSSGGRSSSSSGGSSTPDRQVAKTILPASAFSWEDRTLTITHERITPLGLLSVRWDDATLARGTDYDVYSGSVIVRFGEDFIATQSPGDHTIRVEFLNHTGETTVTVSNTGLTTDVWDDNDTHNPNTGGYPDGGYSGTDNPNTGGGRNIWAALLLGSLGAAALVKLRPRPEVK